MSEIYSWSNSAGGNNSPPPDGAPEGMLRPTVNNVMREIMASLRRWYEVLDWSRPHGVATTSRDSAQVLRVAGADYTSFFTTGRRVRISGAGTRAGVVSSSSYAAPDTLVTLLLEPLSYAELAAGINLTFADTNPDTITAASGTPFSGVIAGDRVRVEKDAAADLNSGTYLVGGATATVLTLDAAETLSVEGPVAAKIYLEAVGIPIGTNLIELARWDTKKSAHRDIGVADGQIPTSDRLKGAAFRNPGHGKGLDADTVDGQHAADLAATAATLSVRNVLVNGSFRRWQRGTTFTNVADASYVCDQWKALVQTATGCTVTKETSDKPAGARVSIKLSANAAGGKFGVVQFVEAEDCFQMIGQTGTLSVYLKGNASVSNARLILVSWTGTEDAIAAGTPDAISAWAAAGADPTLGTSMVLEASAQVALTTSWQRFSVSGLFDAASAKNVGVIILVDDDAITTGDALFVAQAQLELGDTAYELEREAWDRVHAKTSRFFQKTFPEATTPAQNAGTVGSLVGRSTAGLSECWVTWRSSVRMLRLPTVVTYNPSAANANWTDGTVVVIDASDGGVGFTGSGGSATQSKIHATMEAQLF